MTPDDVPPRPSNWFNSPTFAPLFGNPQAQDHAYDYVKGLMTCPDRKSIEPIALLVGHGDVSGLQKFFNAPPGSTTTYRPRSRLSSTTSWPPRPPLAHRRRRHPGRVRLRRAGASTAPGCRQRNGRLGKKDNCQVGVFLVGVTPAGAALLDHRLYLPSPGATTRPRPGGGGRRRTSPRAWPSRPKRRSPPSWSAASRCSGRRHWTGWSPTRSTARRGTSTTRWRGWTSGTSWRCRSPPPSGRGTRPAVSRRTPGGAAAAGQRGRRRRGRGGGGAARRCVAGAAIAAGGVRAAGLRVRRGAGLGDARPEAGAAGLAADAPVAGASRR